MQSALAFVVRHLTNQCFTVFWIVFLGAFSEKTLCFPRKVVFRVFIVFFLRFLSTVRWWNRFSNFAQNVISP